MTFMTPKEKLAQLRNLTEEERIAATAHGARNMTEEERKERDERTASLMRNEQTLEDAEEND